MKSHRKLSNRSIILRSCVVLMTIGWIGAILSTYFTSINTLWFIWVVPLTILVFLFVFFKPNGMPDTDLPTEEDIKKAQEKDNESH